MSEPTNDPRPSRPLSEISHLFLSTLREQTGGEGRARPVRIPPGQRAAAPVSSPMDEQGETRDEPNQRKRITGIVSAHLDGQLGDAALAYAASLASRGERVGIMTVDAAEFRLQLIECDSDVPASDPEVSDLFEARPMSEALRELNHDVDRWLLVIGDRRRLETRSLLNRVDDWTMLTTCDHDGIVAGYRTLKGLAEGAKSPLAIALLDAPGHEQACRAFDKLSGVCRQFLDWDVTHEPLETDVENAQAHTVLWCHTGRDKAQLAAGPQWQVVQEFVELEPDAAANAAHYGNTTISEIADADDELDDAMAQMASEFRQPTFGPPIDESVTHTFEIPPLARPIAAPSQDTMNSETKPMSMPTFATNESMKISATPASSAPMNTPQRYLTPTADKWSPPAEVAPAAAAQHDDAGEVIDLPDGVSVLSAILRCGGTELLATPVTAPMCPGSTVAVDRDRGLVLVAQAGNGLAGMDAIAAAVQWLDDSKQLISMAMPQLAIDASRPTLVQVIIDQADRTAEGLRPLLGNSRITIRSYRKLRWAGRTGLLLDAA